MAEDRLELLCRDKVKIGDSWEDQPSKCQTSVDFEIFLSLLSTDPDSDEAVFPNYFRATSQGEVG